MRDYKTLEFFHGKLKFSAGHFTIFSKTHRERMHGHNYFLHASMTAALDEPGITFDYGIFQEKLRVICRQLHSRFLLPTESPYLSITEDDDYYIAQFNRDRMPFIKDDVVLLPISNITLEELSRWFIQQVIADGAFIKEHDIVALTIKVFNSEDHCASSSWEAA